MKKRRLVYFSEGTDEMQIVCDSIENAMGIFQVDAETLLDRLHNPEGKPLTIELSVVEMTDEEVEALREE